MSEETKKVGRPSKYNEEILEKAKGYIHIYEETLGDVIPSLEGLCIYLGIGRNTAYDWAKQEDRQEFSNTLDLINITQKQVLINKGLTGKFNSAICKLALGNHGFSEKQQQEISGPNGGAQEHTWKVEFIDAPQADKE